MKHPLHRPRPLPHRRHQNGAVMVVVLVMMMLAALTALVVGSMVIGMYLPVFKLAAAI